MTVIIIARSEKEPLWVFGSRKRYYTPDVPVIITCLNSDSMNPHQEALSLG